MIGDVDVAVEDHARARRRRPWRRGRPPLRGAGVAPPSGLRFICRELHGSKVGGEKSPTNGKPSVTISLESLPAADLGVEVEELGGRDHAARRASRPYCTPTLSHGTRAKPSSSDAVDVHQVAQWVHSTPVGALGQLVEVADVGERRVHHERREAEPGAPALGEGRRPARPGRGPSPGSRAARRARRGGSTARSRPRSGSAGRRWR